MLKLVEERADWAEDKALQEAIKWVNEKATIIVEAMLQVVDEYKSSAEY